MSEFWDGIKKQSAQQEKRIAKRLSATQHGGSGSGQFKRNDMHTDAYLVECKRTDNERYIRVDVKEMEALTRRAAEQGKAPVLAIEIKGREYVLLLDADFQELIDQ